MTEFEDVAETVLEIAKRDREIDLLRSENKVLMAALERLLNSDPSGAIATASDEVLAEAANDIDADPVIREQAASVLQAREALRPNTELRGGPR